MNRRLVFLMLTVAVAGTACAQGGLRPYRKSLLVESPSDLPVLGRQGGRGHVLARYQPWKNLSLHRICLGADTVHPRRHRSGPPYAA